MFVSGSLFLSQPKIKIAEVHAKRLADIAENEAIGQAMKKRAEDQVIQAIQEAEEKEKVAKETTANL